MDFENLINDAQNQGFSGWDFSAIEGRWKENPPSWDYKNKVTEYMKSVSSMLDMGTGGGEFLSSLGEFPEYSCATESYKPNIPIARRKLEPLGVKVFSYAKNEELPFEDDTFELIINCHESLSAKEVFRILKPAGRFITQQVGGQDNMKINEWLQDKQESSFADWGLITAVSQLNNAGFEIVESYEEYPVTQFNDIGAVAYYLKAIPWQIPDFDVASNKLRLLSLHKHIQQEGVLSVKSHRFYIEGIKCGN